MTLVQPRVIAEVRKACAQPQPQPQPPRISGWLTWLDDGLPRHVEVRDGCLLVFAAPHCPRPELRLPLRRLHLRPSPSASLTFTLSSQNGQPLAAFQADSDRDFERWAKTLAVELLRQTPLDALRYLDVLAITATAHDAGHVDHEYATDKEMEALLRRCQQADGGASVRDKRRLFEALCRRRARSTDSVSGAGRPLSPQTKRARSLHDLSGAGSAVRDLCRRYEERYVVTPTSASARPTRRDLPPRVPANAFLLRRRLRQAERRLVRLQEAAALAEDNIWRLQTEMASLDSERGCGTTHRSTNSFLVLEQKLVQEEAKLARLQAEANEVLREIEIGTNRFETAIIRSSDNLDQRDSDSSGD